MKKSYNTEKPFYVRGIKVLVCNGGKSVIVYHKYPEISMEQNVAIDNVIQYLMDEMFVVSKKCKVEIHCTEN